MNKVKEYLKNLNIKGIIVFAVLLWMIIAFLIYPNINLILKTFIQDGKFSFRAFDKLFSSDRAMKSLKNSFILAFSMVVTVNVVGIFIVLATEYFDVRGAKILKVGFMSTLVYSGIVLVAGYQFLYSESGFLTNIIATIIPDYTAEWFAGYKAVLFIMTFACTSNHMIFLTNAIRGIDQGTIEAARNMGASQFTIIKKVVLPVLKPTLLSITILTFLIGLGAISAPLVVGGKEFQTINPMILQFAKTQTSRDVAALMAMILGLATLLLLVLMNRIEKGGNYISISKVKTKITKQKINNKPLNIVVHILSYFLFLIYIAPMLLVIIFSFANSVAIYAGKLTLSDLTFTNYRNLFALKGAIDPYLVSISYSLLSAVIVVVICLVASRIIHKSKSILGTTLEFSLLIPWLLPATLIALGLIMTYDLPQPIMFNQVLIGTPFLMLFAYIIVKLPFSLRMLKAALYSFDGSLEDAAKSMGASTYKTFMKIVLPILMPTVMAVIALAFNSMLADYDLSVFLYHPSFEPLGIVIKAATDPQAAQDARAMMFVYSVVLMIMSTTALYFVYGKNSDKRIGSK